MSINIRLSGVALLVLLALGGTWWYASGAVQRWFGGPVVEKSGGSVGNSIVMRTPGGMLELARVKAYERFSRSDTQFLGPISLGTTVSEIEVPVMFRYHIEMAKEWPIACDEQRCIVRTGPVKPTLPVAIFTDEVKKRTEAGWGRFNKEENLAQLEQSLTMELGGRANDERNRRLALEEGRKTVQEFVRTWMARELGARNGAGLNIVVLYPGEPESAAPAAAPLPH